MPQKIVRKSFLEIQSNAIGVTCTIFIFLILDIVIRLMVFATVSWDVNAGKNLVIKSAMVFVLTTWLNILVLFFILVWGRLYLRKNFLDGNIKRIGVRLYLTCFAIMFLIYNVSIIATYYISAIFERIIFVTSNMDKYILVCSVDMLVACIIVTVGFPLLLFCVGMLSGEKFQKNIEISFLSSKKAGHDYKVAILFQAVLFFLLKAVYHFILLLAHFKSTTTEIIALIPITAAGFLFLAFSLVYLADLYNAISRSNIDAF